MACGLFVFVSGKFERGSERKANNFLVSLLSIYSHKAKTIDLTSKNIQGVVLNDTFVKFPLCN